MFPLKPLKSSLPTILIKWKIDWKIHRNKKDCRVNQQFLWILWFYNLKDDWTLK